MPPGPPGRRRVLDSTPLYDAVATMDTITLIRSAIRGLLAAAGGDLAGRLRAVLSSGDDYSSTGKPVIDWDDKTARDALVDSRARDGYALLAVLDGLTVLPEPVGQAMRLLATVLGQDLEAGEDGTLRIARKVAPDRMISTVDPEARHGHKTNHRGFDGYKGHIAVDPDVEVITATAVTAGNAGDVEPVAGLIADLTDPAATDPAAVYGDAAYGAGEVLQHLATAGIDIKTKVQPPVAPTGKFTKDRFDISLRDATVTCPNGLTVSIRPVKGHARHAGKADFGTACATCPCAGGAPTPKPAPASPSAATKPTSPPPAPASKIPPGRPATAPPDPKSNAKSPTSCAAATADDAPACSAAPRRCGLHPPRRRRQPRQTRHPRPHPHHRPRLGAQHRLKTTSPSQPHPANALKGPAPPPQQRFQHPKPSNQRTEPTPPTR